MEAAHTYISQLSEPQYAEKMRRQGALLRMAAKARQYQAVIPVDLRHEDWEDLAECRGEDQSIFYVNRGGSTAHAKFICSLCIVADTCLNVALAREKSDTRHGVWGGLSPIERDDVARERKMHGPEAAAIFVEELRETGYETARNVYRDDGHGQGRA